MLNHYTFPQQADLAIADISITRQREHDVDFTSPFMNLGKCLSVCYVKYLTRQPIQTCFHYQLFSSQLFWT